MINTDLWQDIDVQVIANISNIKLINILVDIPIIACLYSPSSDNIINWKAINREYNCF